MITRRWTVLLITITGIFLALSGLADEPPPPKAKSLVVDVRVQAFDRLVAKPDEAQVKLLSEYTQYYRTKENKSEAEARQMALGASYFATQKIRTDSAEEALRLAAETPTDAVTLRCYIYAMTNGAETIQKQALTALEKFGSTSPDLLPFLRLWNPRSCGELYLTAATQHPDPAVRAHAAFYLARSQQDDLLRLPSPDHLDERLKTLDTDLKQLEKKVAKIVWIENSGQKLGAVVAEDRKRLALVTPGRKAPEFAGKLLDGSDFRLANQRGKVVVLSSWFTGCGPCIALVPDETNLAKQYAQRPFLLLGVNSDKPEVGRKMAAEKQMMWPQFSQGEAATVNKAYWFTAAPSICVIDSKGVIRYWSNGGGQALRTQEFATLIEQLVTEAEKE